MKQRWTNKSGGSDGGERSHLLGVGTPSLITFIISMNRLLPIRSKFLNFDSMHCVRNARKAKFDL